MYVDPRDITLRDRDEFYVEKILAHRGDVGRLKTLVFHDKWRGFDESFKSWNRGRMSYLKVPIIARRFTTTAAGPMDVLNMDYEGPFPEDEDGNTYVLHN